MRSINLLAATVALAGVSAAALAHKEATGIVKTRMDAMTVISQQMKVLGAMVRGKSDFDAPTAVDAAKMIANHAGEIPDLFPQGSIEGPSEALPAIWVDWTQFEQSARKLMREASTLASVASTAVNGKVITEPFAAMAASCKSCHERFRLKK